MANLLQSGISLKVLSQLGFDHEFISLHINCFETCTSAVCLHKTQVLSDVDDFGARQTAYAGISILHDFTEGLPDGLKV